MLASDLLEKLSNFDDLIFDLDDTIYQKLIYDKGAYEDIENHFSINVLRKKINMAKNIIKIRMQKGNEYRNLFDDVKSYYNLPNDSVKLMIDIYRSHDGRYIKYNDSLMPHIFNRIKKHQRVFIITNGNVKVQKIKIKKLKLKNIATDIVICNSNDPKQLKPSKWAYDYLNNKYFLKKTVMIGDSKDIDGQFAINSGISFIKFKYEK